MIINGDANALEVRVAAFLSQDQVLIDELVRGVDIHSLNQEAFNLPSRLIAKTLKFRIIYGGNEYSFANDPEFKHIGGVSKWRKVIEDYFNKYHRIAAWHQELIQEAVETGRIEVPTGRIYNFEPKDGNWPITCIKNYPVQGTAADVMALARVSARNRLNKLSRRDYILLINSVHDSIMADVENECDTVYNVSHTLNDVFIDLPKNFKKLFGVTFNVPMRGEIEYGYDWKHMITFNKSNKIIIGKNAVEEQFLKEAA